MSASAKLLAKVCVAKKRMRDLAAGRFDAAEAQKRVADEAREQVAHQLRTHLDRAQERLSGSGAALLKFEWERTQLVAGTRAAAEVCKTTTAKSAEAQAQLMGRERALRSTERVRDRAQAERAYDANRAEQIAADDLSAARRRT